jgi:DNA-binding transcriptional ArsR family regulator
LIYPQYFDNIRNMEIKAPIKSTETVESLAALAHEARLAVFRLLIQAGPDGLQAGGISEQLQIPPNSLNFHLTRLRYAGLITSSRAGRNIIYSANYERMQNLIGFLTENCCDKSPDGCPPACKPAKPARSKRKQRRQKIVGAL